MLYDGQVKFRVSEGDGEGDVKVCEFRFLNGKFKAALDPAKDAAKLNEDQEVVFLIAQIELSLGNVAAAKEYFEKSIEIEPTDEAYMKLAEIHLKMDNKQQSLTALQEGLKYIFIHNSDLLQRTPTFSTQ